MKWSKYSILFESRRNGWLLFNGVSRNFLKVEPEELDMVREIMKDPEGYDYSDAALLYIQLRSLGFLVEDSQDDAFYNITKMRALTNQYATSSLMLTIAITRACNFDCSYCFEGNRTGRPMSEAVAEKLLRFIEHYRTKNVYLIWYGGEPLLAFDRMLMINSRIRKMGKRVHASLITNGYLLNEEKIARLNELGVSYLQITLDGKKETHDGRRYLKNGAPTYDRILENVDKVMSSDFKGMVHIRVNVDARNEEEFYDVYHMISSRYPETFGKRVTVYPGFVKGDDHPDVSCFFEPEAQGEFLIKMMNEHGISPLSVYPRRQFGGCTLTKRNAFVVGPDGELYKCWDDVGLRDKVVGSIDRFDNWNLGIIAEGMVGCSYLDSQECKECFYFPICTGGCHRIRQKNLHADPDRRHSPCTYFKGNLEQLLELHYERKLSQVHAKQSGNA